MPQEIPVQVYSQSALNGDLLHIKGTASVLYRLQDSGSLRDGSRQ